MFLHKLRVLPIPVNDDKFHRRNKNPKGKKKNAQRCPFLTISNRNSIIVIEEAINDRSSKNIIPTEVDGESDRESNWTCNSHIIYPYYRSWRNDRDGDMVLVKDACVSCSILGSGKLSHDESKSEKERDTSLESKLLKHLRSEYNDLSIITKKISSYTRDILTGITKKTSKKISKSRVIGDQSEVTMQPVAMQYFDKSGQPCLKLRLCENSRTSLFDRNRNDVAIGRPLNSPRNIQQQIQTIFPEHCPPNDSDSSMYSSSSIYDYIMYPGRIISKTRKIVDRKSF